MNIVGDLPTWAVLLLGLLAAAIVILINLGWLLSARAMLEGQRHHRFRQMSGALARFR